jgi:cell division protein FtsZ
MQGVSGITDLITTPGVINLDFADVKSVMSNAGSALMGIGSARGEDRARAGCRAGHLQPAARDVASTAPTVCCCRSPVAPTWACSRSTSRGPTDRGGRAPRGREYHLRHRSSTTALGDEVRVTVIAAGFDGGAPVRRADDRALGSVQGRSAPAAAAPVAAPAAQRQPAAPVETAPQEGAVMTEHAQAPVEPVRPAQPVQAPPRTVTFDENDDLDVPDFLK